MLGPELFLDKYRVPTAHLAGYDYGQRGAYFVTICTRHRQPYFGTVEVPNGDLLAAFVQPTALGQRVLSGWASNPVLRPFRHPRRFCTHARPRPRPVAVR